VDEENLGNDKDLDSFGPSEATASGASNMDVETSPPSSSANKGKSVAASTVLCSVITPYNANPRTPRGIKIVERVRMVYPQLVIRASVLLVAMEVGSPASPVYAQGAARVVSTTLSPPRSLETTHAEVAEGATTATMPPFVMHMEMVEGGAT
jgi:hypothetical protein